MSSIISEQKTKKTARRIIKIFISVIKVASNDGPCDVVEELRKAKRRFGEERGREGKKDGTLWEEKCHFMQQFAVAGLSLSGCGRRPRVCLQCD